MLQNKGQDLREKILTIGTARSTVNPSVGVDIASVDNTDADNMSDEEFKEQVLEEISPILDTVAQIRQVDHILQRESVKVKKFNVTDIVNELKRRKSTAKT